MKTKDRILEALNNLYNERSRRMDNPEYRGSMNIRAYFTYEQIQERMNNPVGIPTIRKWSSVLNESGILLKREKRRYLPEPVTHEVSIKSWEMIKLVRPWTHWTGVTLYGKAEKEREIIGIISHVIKNGRNSLKTKEITTFLDTHNIDEMKKEIDEQYDGSEGFFWIDMAETHIKNIMGGYIK